MTPLDAVSYSFLSLNATEGVSVVRRCTLEGVLLQYRPCAQKRRPIFNYRTGIEEHCAVYSSYRDVSDSPPTNRKSKSLIVVNAFHFLIGIAYIHRTAAD